MLGVEAVVRLYFFQKVYLQKTRTGGFVLTLLIYSGVLCFPRVLLLHLFKKYL